MRGERYLALDGLRGVAAICVALIHAQFAAVHGYLAVDLFFIISGFVIANSYEARLQGGYISTGAYMRARVLRLYPMLLLGAVVGIAVYALGGSDFHPESDADLTLAILSQVAVIPLLSSAGTYFAFNNPPWSIVWELLMNFVHALGVKRLGNRVLVGLIGIAAVGLAASAYAYGSLYIGCLREGAWTALPRAVFGFFMGILLCRTMPRWSPHVPEVPMALPALIFLLLMNMPPNWVPQTKAWGIYDAAVVLFLFAPLVMLIARARGGAVAAALGTLSYPLYAINEPVIFALNRAGYGPETRALALLGLCVIAWAIGKWVDEPLNRWRKGARAAAAAPVAMTTAAAG